MSQHSTACGSDQGGSDQPIPPGRRIVVTGISGAGKSTLAHGIAASTGLPLIHLDLEFWQPGWVEPNEAAWRQRQREILAGEAWIADGNYPETLELRLKRADTVVLLTTPRWRCAGRALLRGFRRPDQLPAGCTYTRWQRLRDEWKLIPRIWRNRSSEQQRELEIIARHGRHTTQHVLNSKRAVAEFLAGIGARTGGGRPSCACREWRVPKLGKSVGLRLWRPRGRRPR